jgi:hypothetical protein
VQREIKNSITFQDVEDTSFFDIITATRAIFLLMMSLNGELDRLGV